MLNLILKELKASKLIICLTIFYVIFNAVIMIPVSDARGYLLSSFLPAFMIIIFVNGFEERKNGIILSCSVPAGRAAVIKAKYIFSLILFAAVLVIYVLVSFITYPYFSNLHFVPIKLLKIGNFIILAAGFSLIVSIFLPLFFKYGIYLSGFLSFLVVIGYFFVFSIFYKYSYFSMLHMFRMVNDQVDTSVLPILYPILILISIFLLSFSIRLSKWIFSQKDIN